MNKLRVTVVAAWPGRSVARELELLPGSTVRDAAETSGLLAEFAENTLNTIRLGVFSKVVSDDMVVSDGDRVEIYRPLPADAKEARRRRSDRRQGRHRK